MNYGLSTLPVAIMGSPQFRVNDLGDGASTLIVTSLGAANIWTREDGSPSQVGDVLSCQPPDGTWQTRAPGAAGAYERCCIKDGCATFNPQGTEGPGYVWALKPLANG